MNDLTLQEHLTFFSQRLTKLLENRGMNAKALSEALNVPDASLYRYLSGERVPRIENILVIAKYFEVSMDWLFGLTDEQYDRLPFDAKNIADSYLMASPRDKMLVDTILANHPNSPGRC